MGRADGATRSIEKVNSTKNGTTGRQLHSEKREVELREGSNFKTTESQGGGEEEGKLEPNGVLRKTRGGVVLWEGGGGEGGTHIHENDLKGGGHRGKRTPYQL